MKIQFSTLGVRRPPIEKSAARAARLALRVKGVTEGVLQIVWTDRVRLRALNRRFRSKNRFTDVIAFRYPPTRGRGPFDPGTTGNDHPFGDVYISVDQARLNARRFGSPVAEEWIRLVTHGTLHLLGYTDYTPRARQRMWAVQEPIVRSVAKTLSTKPRF
jgi:rRNA maturation RNase YbeY